MKSLFTIFITTILICFTYQSSRAQTLTENEQKIENAVKIYNEIKAEVGKLQVNTQRTQSDLKQVENRIKEGLAILSGIADPETDDQAKTIRYFSTNLSYQNGFLYGIYGLNSRMVELLTPCKEFFDQAGPSYFPLRYKFNSKNFIIKYEDFSYSRGQFYAALAEGAVKLSNYTLAIESSRQAVSLTEDAFLKMLSYNFLLNTKSKLEQFDNEMVEQSLNMIAGYVNLNSDDRKMVDSFDIDYKKGWSHLTDAFDKNSSSGDAAAVFSRAAALLVKAGDKELSAAAYQKALDAGNRDKNFLFDLASSGEYSSRTLKGRACDMLAAASSLSCSEMDRLAALYRDLGNTGQAESFSNKARKCNQQAAKSASRSAGGGVHLYLGTYPLSFISHKNYRDYGGVAGISAGKFMLLGSYMKVQKNKYAWTDMFFKEVEDNSNDKYYWSGEQIDVTFRFSPDAFRKKSTTTYLGPQFGYSKRKLTDMHSDVTNLSTGVTQTALVFNPLDTYYQLAFNIGQFVGGKAVGMDFNFSLGASYGMFSLDNPDYNLDDFTYSHGYLDNREEWHIGMVMRLSFTLGLYL